MTSDQPRSLANLFTDDGKSAILERILNYSTLGDLVTCSEICKNTNAVVTSSPAIQLRLRKWFHCVNAEPINQYNPKRSIGEELEELVDREERLSNLKPRLTHHLKLERGLTVAIQQGLMLVGNHRDKFADAENAMTEDGIFYNPLIGFTVYELPSRDKWSGNTEAPGMKIDQGLRCWKTKLPPGFNNVAMDAKENLVVAWTEPVTSITQGDPLQASVFRRFYFFHLIPQPNDKIEFDDDGWLLPIRHQQACLPYIEIETRNGYEPAMGTKVELGLGQKLAVFFEFPTVTGEEAFLAIWNWSTGQSLGRLAPTCQAGAIEDFAFLTENQVVCAARQYKSCCARMELLGAGIDINDRYLPEPLKKAISKVPKNHRCKEELDTVACLNIFTPPYHPHGISFPTFSPLSKEAHNVKPGFATKEGDEEEVCTWDVMNIAEYDAVASFHLPAFYPGQEQLHDEYEGDDNICEFISRNTQLAVTQIPEKGRADDQTPNQYHDWGVLTWSMWGLRGSDTHEPSPAMMRLTIPIRSLLRYSANEILTRTKQEFPDLYTPWLEDFKKKRGIDGKMTAPLALDAISTLSFQFIKQGPWSTALSKVLKDAGERTMTNHFVKTKAGTAVGERADCNQALPCPQEGKLHHHFRHVQWNDWKADVNIQVTSRGVPPRVFGRRVMMLRVPEKLLEIEESLILLDFNQKTLAHSATSHGFNNSLGCIKFRNYNGDVGAGDIQGVFDSKDERQAGVGNLPPAHLNVDFQTRLVHNVEGPTTVNTKYILRTKEITENCKSTSTTGILTGEGILHSEEERIPFFDGERLVLDRGDCADIYYF